MIIKIVSLIVVLVFSFVSRCKLKETYILLPKSLNYCRDKLHPRKLTITKQISLVFNGSSSIDELMSNRTSAILFICEVEVKPLGKNIALLYPGVGSVEFWKLRYQLSLDLPCHSWLHIRLEYLENSYEDNEINPYRKHLNHTSIPLHQALSYSCASNHQIVVQNTLYRKLTIKWDVGHHRNLAESFIDFQLATYIKYSGNLTLHDKKRMCLLQNGFWCEKTANMCINAQLRCDNADSCFDGGSDERDCTSMILPINATYNGLNRLMQSSIWSNLLPWIVIGLILTMMAMALVLVCNQRRTDLNTDSEADADADNDLDDDADADDINAAVTRNAAISHHNSSRDDIRSSNVVNSKLATEIGLIGFKNPYHKRHSSRSKDNNNNNNNHHNTSNITSSVHSDKGVGADDDDDEEAVGFCIKYAGRLHRLNGDPISPELQIKQTHQPVNSSNIYSASTTSSVADSDYNWETNNSNQTTANHFYSNAISHTEASNGDEIVTGNSISSILADDDPRDKSHPSTIATYCPGDMSSNKSDQSKSPESMYMHTITNDNNSTQNDKINQSLSITHC